MSITYPRITHRRRLGFNLIELILAMLIFVIGFLGIVAVFPSAIRAVNRSRNLMMAQDLAEMQMESALATPFSQQVLGPNTQVSVSQLSTVNGVQQITTFKVQTTVTNLQANLDDIRVQVNWSEGAVARIINLESQLHQ